MIQTPVYYPFMSSITNNGRHVAGNGLVEADGRYTINWEEFEAIASDPKVRLFILCNPHNPVSRVFTKEELERMGEICHKYSVVILEDAIHCDLILDKKSKFISISSISNSIAQITITVTSPTKTFNLGGIGAGFAIAPNPQIRQLFQTAWERAGIFGPNLFSGLVTKVVYTQCEEWLNQLLDYLRENVKFLRDFLAEHLPLVRMIEPEGTYLIWLDFRKYFRPSEGSKAASLFVNKARVMTELGDVFGEDGKGFHRLNIACPRSILRQAVERLAKVLKDRKPLE